MQPGKILTIAVLLLCLFCITQKASTETVKCTAITSLPAAINIPGVYCLTGNLSTNITSGAAITINANFVVLDLNGWTLTGTGGATSQTLGITASKRKNINIKNGTIRGFYYGIYLSDGYPYTTSTGDVIEDLHVQASKKYGIAVEAQESIVRNNFVNSTGGSTVQTDTAGIFLAGAGGRVLNNEISDTTSASSLAIGIDVGLTDMLVVNNHITNATYGIVFDTNSTGKYRDTLTSGVTTPYTGGTDAGNNN
jgi:hypothetical protein